MLELRNISKVYNPGSVAELCLFQDFSLQVEKGEFVSVVGSNGSGKTSLLNLICGTMQPDAGSILIDGADITRQPDFVRARRIGRVFQDPAAGTCPGMTVLENMAMAENKGKPFRLTAAVRKKDRERYAALLRDSLHSGLEDKLDVRAGSLSGGQRQALALLMATMTPLDFLILDEHTAALDPSAAQRVMELTDQVVREKGLTALMVTHNLRYACEYGTRLLMLDKGHAVLDIAGEEKRRTKTEDLLDLFTRISIECGN